MMVGVILNQDSILDFPKCPHILSISHSKYHSWISVYTFIFQNGHVVTSPANQLAIRAAHDLKHRGSRLRRIRSGGAVMDIRRI